MFIGRVGCFFCHPWLLYGYLFATTKSIFTTRASQSLHNLSNNCWAWDYGLTRSHPCNFQDPTACCSFAVTFYAAETQTMKTGLQKATSTSVKSFTVQLQQTFRELQRFNSLVPTLFSQSNSNILVSIKQLFLIKQILAFSSLLARGFCGIVLDNRKEQKFYLRLSKEADSW